MDASSIYTIPKLAYNAPPTPTRNFAERIGKYSYRYYPCAKFRGTWLTRLANEFMDELLHSTILIKILIVIHELIKHN